MKYLNEFPLTDPINPLEMEAVPQSYTAWLYCGYSLVGWIYSIILSVTLWDIPVTIDTTQITNIRWMFVLFYFVITQGLG